MKNILFSLILLISYGCLSEAPRDNILDPRSDDFENVGKISGTVSTFYQPYMPLVQAFLRIEPVGLSTQTNENGIFEISNVPSGSYTLKCLYYGYRADTLNLTINNDNHDVNFNLNALPVFEAITVNSHHVSRWFPSEDIYYLNFEVQVNDLDGLNEIDSVKIEIPSISFIDTLFTDGFSGLYRQTILDNQLPVQNIRSLEGIPMHFVCWDRVKNVTFSIEKFIPRIVQDVPVIIAPTALQIINNFPVEFSWQTIFLDYSFSLKIEIYQINIGIFSKVREYDNISSVK